MRRRLMLVAVLGVLFALGWWVGGSRASAAPGLYAKLDTFLEVLETVRANYVDPVDPGSLMTGAMRGMVRSLDPWSRWLDPEELRAARTAIQGTVDGVGLTVDARDGWPTVITPIEGSPAWDAGLQPGDILTRIDGRSTFELGPDEVGARLRGAPSTIVRVTYVRGDDEERELRLERRRFAVRDVPYAFLAAPGVGYVRLAHFSVRSSQAFAGACDSLRGVGARALVVDLRGNPGGTVDEAVAIAGQFLPVGARVIRTEGRVTEANQDFTARAARPDLRTPLVLLVDGGTASASEIVGVALQDHDRAVLVGDTTYGKGVSQQIYPLRGTLAGLQITVSRYLGPSGRALHRPHAGVGASDEEDEDTGDEPALAPRDTTRFRTAAGRPVRAGEGLAPEVVVAADSSLVRARLDAGAARAALERDPVFQRALALLIGARDTRALFAAAGAPLPVARER